MGDFKTKDFDPKAVAEARKAEMEEITGKLEKGVKDIFEGDNYKEYLKFCAKLPRYSVNNQILIMMQKPDATMCQSFTGWKDMNRFVKKGEKGIRVLAPAPYKMEREQDKIGDDGRLVLDKDGEPVKEVVEIKVNAFKPVSTFDISQTEGDPVPQLGVNELTGNVEGYNTLLEAIKGAVAIPIAFENIESGAKGYYHIEENRIAIQEGMSEAQTVKTLLHEASHATLHSREAMNADSVKKSKNQKECEAESVAYVVCQHYGIDTSEYSFGYVAGWSADKEVPELKASLDTVRRAASELIVKIDDKVAELTHVKDKALESEFIEMDNWLKEHADELPFDNPESNRPVGFVEITPPVDMSKFESTKELALVKEEATKEASKDEEPAEKTEKKKSVKKELADKKEKAAKTAKPKKTEHKDYREAI